MEFVLIFILLALYLLPSFLAYGREHPSAAGIFLLNLLLGWTLLGWVLSLVWAASAVAVTTVSGPPVDSRKCPHCAEFIKAEAKLCRYCGRDVQAVGQPTPSGRNLSGS